MDDAYGYDGYDEENPDEDILTPVAKWAPVPPKKVLPKAKAKGKGLLLNKASAPPPAEPMASWEQPPAKRMKVSGWSQQKSEEQVVVSLTRLPQGYDQPKLMKLLEYCGLEPSCLREVELSEPSYEAEEETIAARLTFDCMPNALAACRELNGQEVSTVTGASEFLVAEIEHEDHQMQEEVPKSQGWKEAVLASLAPARKREVIVREPPRKEQGAHIFVKKRKAPLALDDEQVLLDYIEGKHDVAGTREAATPSAISRRNEDSSFVKISSLPEGYDEAKLLGLFEFLEIDVHAIQSLRFLKPYRDQEVLTLSAVLQFDCHESASIACDELNGQEVMTRNNDVKRLVAQLQDDDAALGLGSQAPRQKGKGGKKGRDQVGSQQIYPSVYFSDVPKEFNNESMRQLHLEADVNADTIISMKFLPSKDDYGETCCCIIRYCDDPSAQEAIDALAGSKVLTSSGDRKFLGAKMAKPAAWMKNKW